MDYASAQLMNTLTREFYQQLNEPFFETRKNLWQGWQRILQHMQLFGDAPFVFDVACGNFRFERELLKHYPDAHIWAVDALEQTAEDFGGKIEYKQLDILDALLVSSSDAPSANVLNMDVSPCDVALSLAFMHHVPLFDQRRQLLELLLSALKPKGLLAVSFWQFADDERLRAKAEKTTAAAAKRMDLSGFDEGDYLMGWDGSDEHLRFCHHVSADELDALLSSVQEQALCIDDYYADGATGKLNRYIVLQKRC